MYITHFLSYFFYALYHIAFDNKDYVNPSLRIHETGNGPNHNVDSTFHPVNLTRSLSTMMIRFKGVASGKCLDSQGYPHTHDVDTTLRIWNCAPVPKQSFIVLIITPASGESLIMTEGNKCLGTGPGSNTLVQGFDCSADPVKNNMFWKVVVVSKSNVVQILSLGKNKCMTARGRNSGDEVVVRNCDAGWTDQIWEMNSVNFN